MGCDRALDAGDRGGRRRRGRRSASAPPSRRPRASRGCRRRDGGGRRGRGTPSRARRRRAPRRHSGSRARRPRGRDRRARCRGARRPRRRPVRTTSSPSSRKQTIPAAGLRVQPLGRPARVVGVDHRRAVRRGHEVIAGVEARHLLDVRLAVVRAHDHRVALEEGVRPSGCVHQRADRGVAAHERLVRAVGPGGVRRVVVVGEVVDEQVEPVARDEPAADPRCVCVDRAERPVPHRDRRACAVALVQRVEEEPLRAVDSRCTGDRRQVLRAAPIARDVDRSRREPSDPRALVDRLDVA